MKFTKLPWKKNYRQVPDHVNKKIQSISPKPFVVAVAKKIPASHIAEGRYKHLHLTINNGVVNVVTPIMPDPVTGRYSDWNVNGRLVVFRNLPKTTKTYSWETPNWGDWYNGSHEVIFDRKVFQRKFYPGLEQPLTIELLGELSGVEKEFLIKFSVERRHTTDTNAEDILYDINLLQENVGAIGIYPSDATQEDYLRTIQVDWQLLPPGERDETIARIIKSMKLVNDSQKEQIQDRYSTLDKLGPKQYIVGTDGFNRYFGAKYLDNLVVFENLEYGNAIYVMYDNWQSLSKMSRLQLLKMTDRKFDRIIHIAGWKRALTLLIKRKQRELGQVAEVNT